MYTPKAFAERFGPQQSDLVVAILGASYLDALLEDLLMTRVIADRRSNVVTRPGFARRAETAFALGLLSRDSLDDLHAIAEIRNYFAHKVLDAEASFRDSEVTALSAKLSSSRAAADPESRSVMKEWGYEVDNPRALFIEAMTACASELAHRIEHAPEVGVPEAEPTGRLGLIEWQAVAEIVRRLDARDSKKR